MKKPSDDLEKALNPGEPDEEPGPVSTRKWVIIATFICLLSMIPALVLVFFSPAPTKEQMEQIKRRQNAGP